MPQTLVPDTGCSHRTVETPITWAAPSDDLWVASRSDADGIHFLGFVELSLDTYVAVDGEGAGLGRHTALEVAQRAVLSAHGVSAHDAHDASSWGTVVAPVLTARALRTR